MRILSRCLVVLALLAMTVPDRSQAVAMTKADALVAIDKLTRAIMAANPEYPDPYKVPIGVAIRVPVDSFGHSVTYTYVTESWMLGKNGCFWQIAEGHLAGTLVPTARLDVPPAYTPEPLASVPAPVEQATVFGTIGDKLFPVWAIVAIAGLTAVAVRQRRRKRREQTERELNPATHPPVVTGGLSEDPQTALQQVQAATLVRHGPNRFVQSVERGVLRSTNGRQHFIAPMEHGDGITRNKRFNAGDACYRVQVRIGSDRAEPVTEYWFRHCGNRFGEIKDGKFELPEGWEFVPMPNQSTRAPEPAPAAPDVETAEAADSIEHAAARIQAHTMAQAAVNPNGTYRVTFTVNNGHPTPTEVTATSDGHRPFKTIKYRGGAVEATF